MFHSDYIYEETRVTTVVNGLDFLTKGNIEISRGWKGLFTDTNKRTNINKNALQLFMKGKEWIAALR